LYSESHESGRAFIGDGMQVKRHATVPMGAMWTQQPGVEVEQFGYNADVRESASVRISTSELGRRRILHDRRRSVGLVAGDFETHGRQGMAMGLNRFVIHTSVHQPLIDKPPGWDWGRSVNGHAQ